MTTAGIRSNSSQRHPCQGTASIPGASSAKKVILSHTWPETDNDYVVPIAGLDAARIMLTALSFNQKRWGLHLTGPYFPPELRRERLYYDTREAAKDVLRTESERWLRRALTRHGPVT